MSFRFPSPRYKLTALRASLEPIELVVVDCPEEFIGVVTEALGRRKAK